MSYAWDMFCPECSAALVGNMGEGGDAEIEADQKKYSGMAVFCTTCEILVDFDTNEIVDPKDYHPSQIIQGG